MWEIISDDSELPHIYVHEVNLTGGFIGASTASVLAVHLMGSVTINDGLLQVTAQYKHVVSEIQT